MVPRKSSDRGWEKRHPTRRRRVNFSQRPTKIKTRRRIIRGEKKEEDGMSVLIGRQEGGPGFEGWRTFGETITTHIILTMEEAALMVTVDMGEVEVTVTIKNKKVALFSAGVR